MAKVTIELDTENPDQRKSLAFFLNETSIRAVLFDVMNNADSFLDLQELKAEDHDIAIRASEQIASQVRDLLQDYATRWMD